MIPSTFKPGDKVVYPTMGLCEISKLSDKTEGKFYVLRAGDRTALVPVKSAVLSGLRAPVTREEVDLVLRVLGAKGDADRSTWNRRYREYMAKLNTGSVFDAAEVYRDLKRLSVIKDLSFGERKMVAYAEKLLLDELGVALAPMSAEQVYLTVNRIFKENAA